MLIVAATTGAATGDESPPSAKAVIAAFQEAGWRFAIARRMLPRVEVVQDEPLEVEDWREYDYDGGALRVYVSRDGGDAFALLVDASGPRYADFRQLRATAAYTVQVAEPFVIVIRTRPVGRSPFDRLKSKTWSVQELTALLGAPSYRDHVHGIGWMFLEYVPQGLTFVDDSHRRPDYEWFYLWDCCPKEDGDDADAGDDGTLEAPRGDTLSYDSYRARLRSFARQFGDGLARERREIRKALAAGLRSPDGRFVVAPLNWGLATMQQTIIAERAKPERRYRAEHFTEQKDYRWLDARTVLYEVYTTGIEFHTLDAVTGANRKVLEMADSPREWLTDFGVSGRERFWYTTADAVKHKVTIGQATPHPAPSGAREP